MNNLSDHAEGIPRTTLISVDMAGNPLEVAEMMAKLKSSGLDTRKNIVNGLLDRADESFPLLARLATSHEYWYGDSVDEWSPLCAIHLLAKMKHYRAQLAINSAILQFYNYTGDWLTEDMPHVLAHMGVGAIPMLTALMQYRDADMLVRDCVAEALVIIIHAHPETKPKIVASIMDAARKESDIKARTLLVNSLVDLADPGLYEYFRNSLRTGFVTNEIFDMGVVNMVNATSHSSRKGPKDPLYIFEPRYTRALSFG